MEIALKLDIGFSANDLVHRLYGTRDPLPILWSLGFRALETAVDPKTNFADLSAYAERCNQAGFQVSLHPYSERTPYNPFHFGGKDRLCRAYHAKVFLAAEDAARRQDRDVIVNIHGAAGDKGEDRTALLMRSIKFFTWSREWCLENAPRVRPIVELQFRPYPDESIQRIGDGYGEIEEIARRAEIGICWDFGHSYMNAERFRTPLEPAADWLKMVRHIHLHDVQDMDHHPLVSNRVPWERMLSLALQNGFEGTVVLEVPPQNFLAGGGMSAIARSAERIKTFLAKRLDSRSPAS